MTDSTSINTGALIVSGGAGVAKNMHVGDNLTVGFVAGDYVADRYIKAEKIELSAQMYLDTFYKDLGFYSKGEQYLEDGIPHQRMFFNLV